MRPVLAIIRDSFREALSSRTLQALLGLITLLLLALAIPGLRVDLPSRFQRSDFQQPDFLLSQLSRNPQLQPAVSRLVRGRLSEQTLLRLSAFRKEASETHSDAAVASLLPDLNQLIEGGPLWDAEAWKDVQLGDEARALQRRKWEDLSRAEQQRLNRLLLDAAWGGAVGRAGEPEVWLTYLFGEISIPLEAEAVRSTVLMIAYLFIKWFVGAAGILIAIIFTAAMIPHMFEPGAIDLLLSKPVSRSAMFLTKFFGGCLFILIAGGLFVGGVWLVLGLRHEIWNARILWSLPLFLLAFSVYYSISAAVGVRWRNPILCIALTFVVWAGLSVLHQVWFWGQTFALNGRRAEAILPAGDEGLLVACKNGDVRLWRNDEWESVFAEAATDPNQAIQRGMGLMYPLIGPAISYDGQWIAAVERTVLPQLFTQAGNMVTGSASSNWRREVQMPGPAEGMRIFAESGGAFLIAGPDGLHRLQQSEEASKEWQLAPAAPAEMKWQLPFDAGIAADSGLLLVYSNGRLISLQRGADDLYELRAERRIEESGAALVALTQEVALVVHEDGSVQSFEPEGLEPLRRLGSIEAAPRMIAASPTGDQFAIVDHRRRLHLLQAAAGNLDQPGVRGQGEITAATFRANGHLLVADRFPRVTVYAGEQALQTYEQNDRFSQLFLYVINPLRTVLPKPDELDFLVERAVGAGETEPRVFTEDLSRERGYIDYWTPLWTNIAFVCLVLGGTCFYISRRDF